MSNVIVHSRLSNFLRDHLQSLTKETITKLFVSLYFENGFNFEYRAVIRNCKEIDDAWFGLKNHVSNTLIKEGCENEWFDKKSQMNFLVSQTNQISSMLKNGFDVESIKNLRSCLQLIQHVVENVSLWKLIKYIVENVHLFTFSIFHIIEKT